MATILFDRKMSLTSLLLANTFSWSYIFTINMMVIHHTFFFLKMDSIGWREWTVWAFGQICFFFAILVFICTRQKSGRRGANMDRLVFFAKFIDFNWHCSLKLTRIAKKFFAKIEEKISIMTIYKIVVQDDNLQNSCPGGQFPKNCRQQRSAKKLSTT